MTMSKVYRLVLFLVWWPLFAAAQVQVDGPLRATGATPADRQVTGLQEPMSPGAPQTAELEQNGTHRTAEPLPGATWTVALPLLSVAPPPGTHIVVKAPEQTNGPVTLTLNGFGPFALVSNALQPMDGGTIVPGTMLSLIFDGTAFQVMNGGGYTRRACPEGTTAVNEQFCMGTNEHPPSNLYQAMLTCGTQGMRLCSWGEFYVACMNAASLGLNYMTDNWEWTDDASNEIGSARVVGAGSCSTAGNSIVINSIDRNFHCCWSR